MARGVNKVILVGNLGQDPDVRYLPSGGSVTNINIATSEGWKDKQSGETQERTEWHRVVIYSRLAEIARDYLRKGSKVYIEGSLRTRKWQTKEGQDRYTTEIIAQELQMLDSKGTGAAPTTNPGAYGNQQSNQAQATGNNNNKAMPAGASTQTAGIEEEFDDEIPF